MFSCYVLSFYLLFTFYHIQAKDVKYKPTWESLDSRPIPSWYDEAKIGIFIHWGVYSVPSFASEWFWINWHNNRSDIVQFIEKNYRPGITYQDFAPDFRAEFFDPVKWAELFKKAGAEYVVLTSKHHEGYTLWPSKYSFSWNSVDVGPHKDLIGELAKAIRRNTSLHFGLYHSLFEWFNPMYLYDKSNNFTTQLFVDNKIIPEMKELVYRYKPEIIWSDGEWEATDTYWKSKEFLAWLYNESPVKETIVVNDRWGSNTLCKHGGFLTCADRYNPGVLKERKWENALTIDSKSWGFRRNADLKDFLTAKELITFLAHAISCNGNIIFNVGPTKEGIISPIYEERLSDIGRWLEVNGPAVYKSKPWLICQNDSVTPNVWYTTRKISHNRTDLYAIVLQWPKDNIITLGCPLTSFSTKITMLGIDGSLKWINESGYLEVEFPDKSLTSTDWAWTLKLTRIVNAISHNYSDILS